MKQYHEKVDINKLIGRNIRNERKKRGITREDLASLLGVSISHMGLMERGERGIHALNMVKVCELFKVPVGDLFRNRSERGLTPINIKDSKLKANRDTIYALAAGLGEFETEYAVLMIRGLLTMNKVVDAENKLEGDCDLDD